MTVRIQGNVHMTNNEVLNKLNKKRHAIYDHKEIIEISRVKVIRDFLKNLIHRNIFNNKRERR